MIQRLLLALLILPILAHPETEDPGPTVWDIGLRKILYSPDIKSETIKLTISQDIDSEEQTRTVSFIQGQDIDVFPFIYGKVLNQDRAFLKPAFIPDSLYTWENCEIWEPLAYKTEKGTVISFRIVEPGSDQVRTLKFEFVAINAAKPETPLVASRH